MLCDLCNKNQATVHLTEIIDDQISELHLCEECARKKSLQMEQQFGIADLLAGLAEFGKPEEKAEADFKCSNCGLSYQDFKRVGRLGCGECYPSFRKYLLPLLKKIHGSTQHLGKAPYKIAIARPRKKAPLDELRLRLKQAVENEEFEEAARLRDKIREFEKKNEAR
jgi:protein arginine kinase activator